MILSDHSSWSTSFNWLVSWHRRVFKQIFKGVEVGALKRPFQKLNASLLFPLKNKLWCSFGIIVLLEQLILHKFQRYSCWFNLGSPSSPLFYPLCAIYQYHLQQNSHRTWCYCHRAWPFLFTPSNISLIEGNFSIFFSSDHMTFLQNAFGLSVWATANFSRAWRYRISFGAGASLLVSIFLVFKQFPGQASGFRLPGLFMNIQTIFPFIWGWKFGSSSRSW